jgi:outer membrane protein OmpA-like peptidoglycan-associated protein
MKRRNGLIVAAGVSALFLTIGQPSFGQSENDFINGLRPIPKALQSGHSGLPVIGPAVRAPHDANYRSTSFQTGGASAGASHHAAALATRVAALRGCPAQADTGDKPQVSTSRISFEFGSAVLTPEAQQVLRNLGNALNGPLHAAKSIEIEGHTDAVGSFGYNEQLSTARAAAAKDFLVNVMGVAPARLLAVGRAFCDPVDPAHPDSADNRRVVIVNQEG